jgi:uncharacterized repeat protein (TIGR04138 family)
MPLSTHAPRQRLRYHREAYEFVEHALRVAQDMLGRTPAPGSDSESAHISGRELLEGIRVLALKQFGMMTCAVFAHWGVYGTDDFGRIVFEMVEREQFRRTERDQLSDFESVYSFEEVFDEDYQIDTTKAFRA